MLIQYTLHIAYIDGQLALCTITVIVLIMLFMSHEYYAVIQD